MRLHELLPLYLDGTDRVVDVTPELAELRRHLRPPADMPYRSHGLDEAAQLDLGPGALLLGLVGPNPPTHTDPDALAPVLRRLQPGARLILLVGWPIEALPYHRLLGPLVEGRCQVREAVPLDRAPIPGVQCALIVECVDKLAPLRSYLTDIGTEPARDAEPDTETVDDLRTVLRVVNEYVFTDLVVRPLRRRLLELENAVVERAEAVDRAEELSRRLDELTGRIEELDRLVAERNAEVRVAEQKLARSEARLAVLESSTSMQVGRAVVEGVRHPGRALVSVPSGLARVWHERRSRKRSAGSRGPATPASARASAPAPAAAVAPARPTAPAPPAPAQAAPPADRVVPIALPVIELATDPTTGPATRPLLTMTLPGDLWVPRRLAEQGLAGYEPESLACYLAAIDVAGPGAVLDIGANVGIYAALASALTDREVWAFEPSPELVAAARRFATDNDLGYRTEALALGAENGSATFYLSDVTDTSNSLAAGFRASSAQIEVPVETLDSFVARTGAVPAVLKVDTETTEPDVLAGAAKTIAEHRPWILCEVLAGRVEQRLTEVLTPFGYHWYHVTEEPPYTPAERIEGDGTYRNLMWLFAPVQPGADFWTAVRRRAAALAGCTPERGRELQAAS